MKTGLFLLLALIVTGCPAGHSGIAGSGQSKTELRNVPPFTALETDGDYRIEIICQDKQSVEISGDDNLLPLIKTEVKAGKLLIEEQEHLAPKEKLVVKIHIPTLKAISLNGAAQLNLKALKTDSFDLDSSGASKMELAGMAKQFKLQVSGAASIHSSELHTQQTFIDMSGAGDASVYASEQLDVHISGMGKVVYSGHPKKVNQDISGAGQIQAAEGQ